MGKRTIAREVRRAILVYRIRAIIYSRKII
jgi:hypothetical protein